MTAPTKNCCRPSVEALEARDLMSANLAAAPPRVPAPATELAPHHPAALLRTLPATAPDTPATAAPLLSPTPSPEAGPSWYDKWAARLGQQVHYLFDVWCVDGGKNAWFIRSSSLANAEIWPQTEPNYYLAKVTIDLDFYWPLAPARLTFTLDMHADGVRPDYQWNTMYGQGERNGGPDPSLFGLLVAARSRVDKVVMPPEAQSPSNAAPAPGAPALAATDGYFAGPGRQPEGAPFHAGADVASVAPKAGAGANAHLDALFASPGQPGRQDW
jgi:hypothetical protein